MNKVENIAIIPARKNSKGIKFKNRKYFFKTAEFVKKLKFIDRVIVSSDDSFIINLAKKSNFEYHERPKQYCKDNTSIKSTFENIIKDKKIYKKSNLWLFYITLPFRRKIDFANAFKITQKKTFKSICSFSEIPYKYHPYYAWRIESGVKNFIKNNIFRRQDLPKAFFHYHYLSCIKASEVSRCNEELINKKTIPIKINKKILPMLIELDTHEDIMVAKELGILQ